MYGMSSARSISAMESLPNRGVGSTAALAFGDGFVMSFIGDFLRQLVKNGLRSRNSTRSAGIRPHVSCTVAAAQSAALRDKLAARDSRSRIGLAMVPDDS